MKNKGFTLIELMVSIAIMMILAIMLVPAINAIRKKVLNNLYDTKVKQILSTSQSWGRENLVRIPQFVSSAYTGNEKTCTKDCACILVRELINEGFLAGDKNDKTELQNPINKKSMNGMLVCVRFDNNDEMSRKIVSYIVEE